MQTNVRLHIIVEKNDDNLSEIFLRTTIHALLWYLSNNDSFLLGHLIFLVFILALKTFILLAFRKSFQSNIYLLLQSMKSTFLVGVNQEYLGKVESNVEISCFPSSLLTKS